MRKKMSFMLQERIFHQLLKFNSGINFNNINIIYILLFIIDTDIK